MEQFFIADTHFGHHNIIAMDDRPFSSVDEMDETLIRLWNAKVSEQDEVYFLGDFAFKSSCPATVYLKQLKGHKHLIVGNHEKLVLNDPQALAFFESVDYLKDLHENNRHLVLCHYPIAEWNGYFHGSYLIYGHIHINANTPGSRMIWEEERALNAGCMINNYEPVTFEELVENNRRFKKALSETRIRQLLAGSTKV